MPIKEGVIEVVVVKEMPKPDKYGNTYRVNFLIEGDWFSWGNSKSGDRAVRFGKKGATFKKGDKVGFRYKQNGDFKNVDNSSFEVTESSPDNTDNTNNNTKQTNTYKKQDDDYKLGPLVGQSMNMAVSLGLVESYDELLDKNNIAKAVALYKQAKDMFMEEFKNPTEARENKEFSKQYSDKVYSVSDDDDIPF